MHNVTRMPCIKFHSSPYARSIQDDLGPFEKKRYETKKTNKNRICIIWNLYVVIHINHTFIKDVADLLS